VVHDLIRNQLPLVWIKSGHQEEDYAHLESEKVDAAARRSPTIIF